MLRVLCGADLNMDAMIGDWVAWRLSIVRDHRDFGPMTTMGVFDVAGDRPALIAGAVFHRFRGFDIEITFAADTPRWATRGVIRAILDYPFNQVGCERVTTIVGRRNKRSRRLQKGLGFKEEGIVRRGYDGRQDAVIYGMLRHECRWLENSDGQRVTLAAAGT